MISAFAIIRLESGDTKIDGEIQKYIDEAIKLGWVKKMKLRSMESFPEKSSSFLIRSMDLNKLQAFRDLQRPSR